MYSLSDDNETISKRAFVLFSKSNPAIMKGSAFNTLFLNRATDILHQKSIPDQVLSRLSSIILYSIQNFPDNVIDSLGPIFQLLSRIDNTGVLEMFNACLSNDQLFEPLQKYLIQANFSKCVLDAVEATSSFEFKSKYMRLIRLGLQCNVLCPNFQNKYMAEHLISMLEETDVLFLSELWRSLTSLLCKELVSDLMPAVPKAVAIVSDSYTNLLMYRIFAFDFIGKYITLDPGCMEFLIDGQILEVSARLMMQFRNSTNLIASIFKFFQNGFKIPIFNDWIFNRLIRLLMVTAKANDHTAFSAYSYNYITFVWKAVKHDKEMKERLLEIPGFRAFNSQYLIPYNNVLEDRYGGGYQATVDGNNPLFID